jgi:acetolactate synthase I/II/III large subunit
VSTATDTAAAPPGSPPARQRTPAPATGAGALVATLVAHGVDRIFCVAGESYLDVLDVLHDTPQIDVVTSRHEGSAGFAALADAKLTRRAGVVLVNRGPGATNAAIALHSAQQDATPLLLVVGHVRHSEIGRGGFQEMNYELTFGDVAKGVWTVTDARRVGETVRRALRLAEAGAPGPVVVVIPEDLLGVAAAAQPAEPAPAANPGYHPDDVQRCATLLSQARSPLLVVGDRLGDDSGRQAIRHAAQRLHLPVVTANKRQDLIDNDHSGYAGHLHLGTDATRWELFDEADLVLAVGTRLDAVTSRSFGWPDPARSRLVHVYPDPAWLGRVHRPDLPVLADPGAFLTALTAACEVDPGRWLSWSSRLRARQVESARWQPVEASDGVPFGAVVAAIDTALDDAVVTVDAGNFSTWVHRYLRTGGRRRLLGMSGGAMGFGVPAGVAAALREPHRRVVAFVGDGGFLMTGTELATAVQRRARLIVVVADNGSYGTIRQHQERAYPGRRVATDLANPDFAAMAWAFGATGLSVRCVEDIEQAVPVAVDCDGPVVVHVRTSLEWISAYQQLPGATR